MWANFQGKTGFINKTKKLETKKKLSNSCKPLDMKNEEQRIVFI